MYPMINDISPCMGMGMNPYMSMGINPYMMAMQPATMEQFRNQQRLTADLTGNRIDFMGKINPLFSLSRDNRLGMNKSIFNCQANFSDAYSPYSSRNIDSTRNMMTAMNNYQMSMMMNPFAMGYGSIMI